MILIDMEMPKHCEECKLSCNGRCLANMRRDKTLDNLCPLKELPPHGRLIDVDKVLDELAHNLGLRSLDYLTPSERAIVSWFRDAPTVIPASRKE